MNKNGRVTRFGHIENRDSEISREMSGVIAEANDEDGKFKTGPSWSFRNANYRRGTLEVIRGDVKHKISRARYPALILINALVLIIDYCINVRALVQGAITHLHRSIIVAQLMH